MRSFYRFASGFASVVMAMAFGGCGEVKMPEPFEPVTDASKLFMGVTLNHRAINLSTVSPYDTFRLVLTPWNGLGEPMNGLPAPTFHSSDTTKVWVTPDGLLQARAPGAEVNVIAEILADGNIRHADTAWVSVIDHAPPEVKTFRIVRDPETPTVWSILSEGLARGYAFLFSVLLGMQLEPSIPLEVLDEGGNPIWNLVVEYRSSDPGIVPIIDKRTGEVWPPRGLGGEVTISVHTVAYGTVLADSMKVKVPPAPLLNAVSIQKGDDGRTEMVPTEVIVLKGGMVLWSNSLTTPVEIEFDRVDGVAPIPPPLCVVMSDCNGGNIGKFVPVPLEEFEGGVEAWLSGTRGRVFEVPGVYQYRIPTTGHTGRVVVRDDDTP